MEQKSTLLIKNVHLVQSDRILEDAILGIKEGKIERIDTESGSIAQAYEQVLDGKGLFLSPGLIDSHTHGGITYDFLTAEKDEILKLVKWYASNGVTGILPTLSAGLKDDFLLSSQRLEEFKTDSPWGEHILGMHIEGPYVNEKRKGAQPFDKDNQPSVSDVDDYLLYLQDAVRVMTLAPELEGCMDLVERLSAQGIICSAGHSDASYEVIMEAVKKGLTRTTHTFNGMSPFHHRQPGIVGAAMVSDEIFAELTLDGFHVHPGAAKALIRAKGLEKVLLITDSMQATGLGDGEFVRPGNRKIHVKDGIARLESGSIAGSVLTLNRAVYNAMHMLGYPLHVAINLATRNVAQSLGLKQTGEIKPGFAADLFLHDEQLNVYHTIKNGKLVYTKEEK